MMAKLHGVFCWRQNRVPSPASTTATPARFTSAVGISDIMACCRRPDDCLPSSANARAVSNREREAFLDVVRQSGGLALCVHGLDELERP